jgi:DNA-binding NtrC family response regulator
MAPRVLLTMDDLETAVPLNAALEQAGFATTLVSAMDDVRAALKRANPDLVILSGAVHEAPALALTAMARDAEISTLALLEPTDSGGAERVTRLGATAVMIKPARPDEAVAPRPGSSSGAGCRSAPASSASARSGSAGQIEQMAPVTSTLIQGESGTGKELVAKGLHDLSPRRGQPFIAVNCAALAETLLESELFGHEKGAFTGAAERRLGRFELADGGTIFLDEIGEIPASTQVKLLRVLESRTFFRVGGTQPIKVDVRVVAATNLNLRDAVHLGNFRDDLYYRLSVLNIYLPPLRERREDIPLLVRRFIREFAKAHDRPFRGITPEALERLVGAPWPGNVSLRNIIGPWVLAPGPKRASDIPADVLEGRKPAASGSPAGANCSQEWSSSYVISWTYGTRWRGCGADRQSLSGSIRPGGLTRWRIMGSPRHDSGSVIYKSHDYGRCRKRHRPLLDTTGNRRKAAEVLGIGERTLYRKIKAFSLG